MWPSQRNGGSSQPSAPIEWVESTQFDCFLKSAVASIPCNIYLSSLRSITCAGGAPLSVSWVWATAPSETCNEWRISTDSPCGRQSVNERTHLSWIANFSLDNCNSRTPARVVSSGKNWGCVFYIKGRWNGSVGCREIYGWFLWRF